MSQTSHTKLGELFANSAQAQQLGRDYVDARVYRAIANRLSDAETDPVELRNQVLASLADKDEDFAANFGFLIPDGVEPDSTGADVAGNEGFPSLTAETRSKELEAQRDQESDDDGGFPSLNAETRRGE